MKQVVLIASGVVIGGLVLLGVVWFYNQNQLREAQKQLLQAEYEDQIARCEAQTRTNMELSRQLSQQYPEYHPPDPRFEGLTPEKITADCQALVRAGDRW